MAKNIKNTKKYIKKSVFRKTRKNKFRRTKRRGRGGIVNPFTGPSSNSFANKVDCSNMDVDTIKDLKELHSRYQKCCPKNSFGFKNSSAICKKMEKNFNSLWKAENDSHGYYGYDKTPTPTP